MRARRLTASALLGALALTACTTGASTQGRPSADGAKTGGVLRVGITALGSVDPGNLYEPAGELVGSLLCDPLLTSDPVTGELLPGLAETFVVSDEGQRIVLRLRSGLRFSDGSDVAADDVAFSLSRVASADYAGAAAPVLLPVLGYAEIHGDVEAEDSADLRRLRGVKAVDSRTVEIVLREPRADFVRALTSRLLSPVPRAAVERDPRGFARQPVCTGPYRLTAPVAPGATSLRLEHWDGYSAPLSSTTRGGQGWVDTVEVRVYPTADAAAAAAVAGEVDIAAARPSDRDVEDVPGGEVELLGLPTGDGAPFADVRLRQALALALDRQALVDAVFPGTRDPATGFLPPTSRQAYRADACDELPVRGDIARAKALLTKVGAAPADLRFPLYVNPDGRNRTLADAVARRWKEVLGVTAVVTELPLDQLLSRGRATAGLDGAFRFSWSTRVPDPDAFLSPLFTTDAIGRDNLSRFSDARVDALLLRQAREASEEEDRLLDQRAAEDVLCEQLPMIPLTTTRARYVVADRVASAVSDPTASGFVDATTGLPLLRELYLR